MKKKDIVYKIFILLFLTIFLYSLYQIYIWHQDNKHTESILEEIEEIADIKDNTSEQIEFKSNINYDELKNINSDTIGWIKVNGTNIDYPVVQTNNNKYYLTHSFDKKYTDAGWIFLDYRNNSNAEDKNTIIYGHARKDKSMFGSLKNTFNSDWFNNEENHIIEFDTINEIKKYQVFSIYHIKTEDYYITTNFKNDDDFNKFLNTLKSRSIHNFNVDLNTNDKILTLSSCYNNTDKTVLHAKLIEKETISE